MSNYTVAAFYKFTKLSDLFEVKRTIATQAASLNIMGTIILAPEGINGTIVGTDPELKTFLAFMKAFSSFSDLECKFSETESLPFHKTKILLKQEIVTLGMPEINPAEKTGIHVSPEEWNALISDPAVTIIDTRNDYEVALGSFKNALDPKTEQFRDFPNYVNQNLDPNQNKKIAMFCTGGIRCEKASAYLLEQGFEQVYQLDGGILKYLEKIDEKNSLWQGHCFIFDDRRTLGKDTILKVQTTELNS